MRSVILGLLTALALTGCSEDPAAVGAAYDTCGKAFDGLEHVGEIGDYAQLEDGDRTVVVSSDDPPGGVDSDSAESVVFVLVDCLLDNLDAPAAVTAKLGSTTAQMGRQSDSWETEGGAGVEATWSYHPDNGLDLVLEES